VARGPLLLRPNNNKKEPAFAEEIMNEAQRLHEEYQESWNTFSRPTAPALHYNFAKGLQAESVRHLWKAWESGTPNLSEQTIREQAGSSSDRFRLYHVFHPKNNRTGKREAHPAWGTMIKIAGKGVFALSRPQRRLPLPSGPGA
jgi:hypothetical protein